MPEKASELYEKYVRANGFERVGLFESLTEHFGVKRALYPGSFVHVSPSLVLPSVTYVDNDRRAPGFFNDPAVLQMVAKRKQYDEEAEVVFHAADYGTEFGEPDESFDLLISQYAGPISQACKRYLKVGGFLVANNSHGDASLASLDDDYELVAVINHRGDRYTLSETDLQDYFVTKSGKPVRRESVEESGRGVAYTKSPSEYVFRRRS